MKLSAKVLSPPAAEESVLELESLLPGDTPAEYVAFLRQHDGAEFCFTDIDWSRDGFDSLRLFSAREMLRTLRSDSCARALPSVLIIGTDSGGQCLAYDMRNRGQWPLVVYCPGCAHDIAYIHVAGSLSEVLTRYATNA